MKKAKIQNPGRRGLRAWLTPNEGTNDKGRNERKREQREALKGYTRKQLNEMHAAEVRRGNRAKGLDEHGTPLKEKLNG